MDTATNVGRALPWNTGNLLGQKPPLKLKEIWAIRIRLLRERRGAHVRSPNRRCRAKTGFFIRRFSCRPGTGHQLRWFVTTSLDHPTPTPSSTGIERPDLLRALAAG